MRLACVSEVVLDEGTKARIAAFKARIVVDPTPLDVIAGILSYFDKEEFTTDFDKIHSQFFAFRDEELFKEFSFKDNGIYPYSELLEDIFSRLSVSGLLTCQNPIYQRFEIKEKQKEIIRKTSLRKFSDPQKQELERISKIIQRSLETK